MTMETHGWFSGISNLSWQDYSVLILLIGFSLFLGIFLGRKESDTKDFFLGGRKIPWWAACLSFIATEISAVTIIAVPAVAYMENWEYIQFFIGSFAARLVIAFLFIPAFYKYDCTSIYEFLKHRFGVQTQYMASVLFLITRLLASAVRLTVACLAVSILIGWKIIPTLILFSVISIFYITWGGIKAIIWTNVVQASTFIIGGVVTIVFLLTRIEGGIGAVIEVTEAAGRIKMFNWGPSVDELGIMVFIKKIFSDPNIIWIAVINGFFGSMAAFGTDQELMQRLLTVKTRKESQKTMLVTPIGSFFVLITFLSIGALLYTFYAQNPGLPLPDKPDKIFPHFIGSVMPVFMRGLLLSAIVMASIDSPLGSLTASFVTDIYRPLIRKGRTESHYLMVSRVCVIVFGIILGVFAYFFSHFDKFLWFAFTIGSITYGALLGVFLLGLLTKRKANLSNVAGMVVSSVTILTLVILSKLDIITLGWSYFLVIGTAMTFGIGWFFGRDENEGLKT